MATNKIARGPKSTKRLTQKPAGSPSPHRGAPGIVGESRARHGAAHIAEAPPVRLVERSPEEDGVPELTPEQRMRRLAEDQRREGELHEEYLGRLSSVLSGGLWVDQTEENLTTGVALSRVAGAQLKAIVIALGAGSADFGPDGWSLESDALSAAETSMALSGIAAMLNDGVRVVEHLKRTGNLRSSYERPGDAAPAAGGAS